MSGRSFKSIEASVKEIFDEANSVTPLPKLISTKPDIKPTQLLDELD